MKLLKPAGALLDSLRYGTSPRATPEHGHSTVCAAARFGNFSARTRPARPVPSSSRSSASISTNQRSGTLHVEICSCWRRAPCSRARAPERQSRDLLQARQRRRHERVRRGPARRRGHPRRLGHPHPEVPRADQRRRRPPPARTRRPAGRPGGSSPRRSASSTAVRRRPGPSAGAIAPARHAHTGASRSDGAGQMHSAVRTPADMRRTESAALRDRRTDCPRATTTMARQNYASEKNRPRDPPPPRRRRHGRFPTRAPDHQFESDGVQRRPGTSRSCSARTPPAGLRAIIAIYSTARAPRSAGPGSIPTRRRTRARRRPRPLPRHGLQERAAGLDLGGGKAVIIGRPAEKTEALLRAYGRFVQSLGGRYVTACDVGTYARTWTSSPASPGS